MSLEFGLLIVAYISAGYLLAVYAQDTATWRLKTKRAFVLFWLTWPVRLVMRVRLLPPKRHGHPPRP